MSHTVFACVMLAALLHAVWNALVKSGGDRLLVLAAVNVTAMLSGAVLLPLTPLPASACWPFLAASAVLHNGYYFFLLQAYRVGDLSQVYPLARGSAPLLVTAGAAVLAGEHLPAVATAGVLIACAGIISLAFEGGVPWRQDARPVWFALGTSAFIAAYTVTDGMGVRRTPEALGYIAWLFFIDGWLIGIYAWWRRRSTLGEFLRHEWRRCVGGGLASILAYGLVIWAMDGGAMGMVSALRETSVLFATGIGIVVLGERCTWRRVLAALVVSGGVGLMHISG